LGRPSDPVLQALREALARRGRTVAEVASQTGLDRAHLRRALKGTDALTVDDLIALSNALQLGPSDLGAEVPESPAAAVSGLRLVAAPEEEPPAPELGVDPWGNHVEQLFRVGFQLGCDFFFLSTADQLEGSGVPESVLARFRGKELPVKLDAAYHRFNEPKYGPEGVTLLLSFDALCRCTFPWAAVRQVVFFPATPEAAPAEPERPKLRLV
jgi:transcriptional regulator with XRE-family HTH domain